MKKKQELAKTESLLPAIVTQTEESTDLFDPADNLEGVTPELPVIEIIHRGQMFRVKDAGTPPFAEFAGIILYQHKARAYWPKPPEEGQKQPPSCTSLDGRFAEPPIPDEKGNDGCPIPADLRAKNKEKYGNAFVCGTCPMNQWGTDPRGRRGKACSEKRRIFVLATTPDLAAFLPYRLIAPASSLKKTDTVFTNLAAKRIPHQVVVTRFSLLKEQDPAGNEYSVLVMEPNLDKHLGIEDQKVLKELIGKFSAGFKATPDVGEYTAPEADAPTREQYQEPADDDPF